MIELVVPWTAELVATLLVQVALPALLAAVMYVNLTRYGEERWLAWIVGTFLAGLGNGGFGSIVVALLYYTVEGSGSGG